jgi:hypothetical protein
LEQSEVKAAAPRRHPSKRGTRFDVLSDEGDLTAAKESSMHLMIPRGRSLVLPVLLALAALVAFTTLKASAASLSVSTSSLASGEVGVSYAQVLAGSGGTAPYTWAINSGALPTGTALDPSTGAITGAPTVAGLYNFTVRITDSTTATALQALSITVQPALSVSTSSLSTAQVGMPYAETLAASGGVAPYSWLVTVGPLPAGLTLNASTGAISGTPTAAGTTPLTVQVTDSLSQTATKALSLTVSASGSLIVTKSTLPNGTIGAPYSQTLTASGGTTPYTWSITTGGLPAGLTLVPGTGVISGTPTASGTTTFTATVTDNVLATATRILTIAVSPLLVTTTSLPSGQVGVAYSQTLAASGGTSPYSWAVSGGALPAGLTLSTAGVLSGTPTTAGLSSFSVQVTDASSVVANATLTVSVLAVGATPTPTVTGTPGENGEHGLCNAYFRGSANGQEHKHAAPPFQALAQDAEQAGMSVEAFCGRAEPTPSASVTTSAPDSHGNGKSNNAGGKGRGH